MILESILSCSYLLLACGTCIYQLRKQSHELYNKSLPQFTYAFIGISVIGIRSLVVVVYKLFLKEYTFDPEFIQIEEERAKSKHNVLDEFLGTLGTASATYSLYYHHERCLLGACFAVSFALCNLHKLCRSKESAELQETGTPGICAFTSRISPDVDSDCFFLLWIFFNGYYTYAVGSNYGLAANYPYLITAWTLPTEGFYQGWTIRRTISDYMMTAYVILMTEALRQAKAA